MILPDLLVPNLKIVFCGTAASTVSARENAYYAKPSNYFWRTLHQINLTPYQFSPQEFNKLLDYGMGLTDIAKHSIGNDDVLAKSDFDAQDLEQKIQAHQPAILAFTSKRAASEFFGKPTSKISYGLQDDKLGVTQFWVLSSPSGSARAYWDVSVWQALADKVGKLSDS
ncbi:MAG: mismatch-specific DNA-glycosylase [Phototrophicaceae bacterium]